MTGVGIPAGFVQDGIFIKRIWRRNILWKPVPSLTVSKPLYDELRRQFHTLRLTIIETSEVFEIPAALFDQKRITYNYGNGENYRVAICEWDKLQLKLRL
jgi:hypothetical protein